MYQVDKSYGTVVKTNVISGYQNTFKELFPGKSFGLFVFYFLFIGFLGGLLVKLLSPRNGNPSKEVQ